MPQIFNVHPTHPQPRLIRIAAATLRDGGVVAYPTDSCYALGCRLDDAEAVNRIRTIRGIDERHHLTMMCRDMADVGRFARVDNEQFRLIRRGTPGAFTYLLPATREVPRRLLHPRRRTIGVRIPDHPVAEALLVEAETPIISTTLIPAGSTQPLNDAEAIREQVGRAIDVLLDAGPCRGLPTTVIDLSQRPAVLVRHGAEDPSRLGLSIIEART